MNKPTLFLLPGTMCDSTLWQHMEPVLSPQFQLQHVAIPKRPSLNEMVETLASSLPDEPVNLLGFSLGGYLSAKFSKTHPHRVKRLMVLANSPCSLPESELSQRRQTIAFLQKFAYQGATGARIQQLLGQANKTNTGIIAHIQQMEREVGLTELVPQLQATSDREDLVEFFQGTKIPTHFVFGDEDVLVNESWFNSLNNPNVKMTKLKNVGHMSTLEAPEDTANRVFEHFFNGFC